MVKAIGDSISMSEYNGIVYLLRKFKKIVRHETINKTILKTDIGTLNVTSGFINVGDNFILENDVKIISQNCLPLTTYSLTFYIINVDTSEEIIEVPVTLSNDTDAYGNLEITIPENLLSDGEEIKRDFKMEVTFQDHEGRSPTRLINLDLTTDKKYIKEGETATVTATLHNVDDEPLENYTVFFDVNGVEISKITNSDGEAELSITGTGNNGVIKIKVLNEEINIIDYYFYDHAIYADHNLNYWSGNWEIDYGLESTFLRLCAKGASNFCPSILPTQTDITKRLEFDTPYSMEFDIYLTSDDVYLRVWDGNTSPFTIYFNYLINKTGHYKLIVREDIIQLWIDDQLYEEVVNISDDTSVSFVTMKTTDATCKYFEFANLIIYNYNIIEPPAHDYDLSVVGTSIIQSGDNTTVTATLTDNTVPVSGETISYQIIHNSSVLDSGSITTDENGQATINYTGTGIGDVSFILSYASSVSQTYTIEDCILYNTNTFTPSAGYTNYLSRTLSDFSFDGSIDYEFEIDFKTSSEGGGFSIAPITDPTYTKHIAFGYNVNEITAYWGNSTASDESSERHPQTVTFDTYNHWKITKNGSDFEWDRDNGADTYSLTAAWLGTYGQMGLYFYKWRSPDLTVKNIKIKAL